jgi:hypothetical protein
VLHTRISEQLAEDIRQLAEELRVPVSNLVRNVLEEAFDAVESMTGSVGDLVGDVVDEADRVRARYERRRRAAPRRRRDGEAEPSEPAAGETRPEFPDVVGWQPLILERGQRCADCGGELERGERAFVGLGSAGLTPTTLCSECMQARR